MTAWIEERVAAFKKGAAPVWEGDFEDRALFQRLWQVAAETGLCRVGIPVAYGGDGGGGVEISQMLRILTRETENIGLPFALMVSCVVAHFMVGAWGDAEQKARWLVPLAGGAFPSAFAVSEAGVGAHPKKLSTHAEAVHGSWLLTGEKSYISNGPLAGLVVVVAVVGEDQGRKAFSAFLVDGMAVGVDSSKALSLPFFRPAHHGTLGFDGVDLGTDSILGPPGGAYESLVIPFRRYEDAMMMGCTLGALECVLGRMAASDFPFDDGMCETLGALKAHVTALNLVARESARLTADPSPEAVTASTALLLHFRRGVALCQTLVTSLEAAGAPLDATVRAMMTDLEASARITAGVSTIRQRNLGRGCLVDPR